MKTLHLPGRKFYAASGVMNWPRFVPLFLLMLAVSTATSSKCAGTARDRDQFANSAILPDSGAW
jgi:hypothetical protein